MTYTNTYPPPPLAPPPHPSLTGSDAKGWKIEPEGRLALPAYANPNGDDHLVSERKR